MQTSLPTPDDTPADPGLLNELTGLTGLFNPENIWKEEEALDTLDEQQAQAQPEPPAADQPYPAPSDR